MLSTPISLLERTGREPLTVLALIAARRRPAARTTRASGATRK
jgi:hypothetical protein